MGTRTIQKMNLRGYATESAFQTSGGAFGFRMFIAEFLDLLFMSLALI